MSQLLMKLWKEGSFRHSSSGQMSPKDWKWPDLICICPDESIGTHKVGIGPKFWKLRPPPYHLHITSISKNCFILIWRYLHICRNSSVVFSQFSSQNENLNSNLLSNFTSQMYHLKTIVRLCWNAIFKEINGSNREAEKSILFVLHVHYFSSVIHLWSHLIWFQTDCKIT